MIHLKNYIRGYAQVPWQTQDPLEVHRQAKQSQNEHFTRITKSDALYGQANLGKRPRMLQLLGERGRRPRRADPGRARTVHHASRADSGSLRAVAHCTLRHLLPRVQSAH